MFCFQVKVARVEFVGLIGGNDVVWRGSGDVSRRAFDVLERSCGVRAHLPFTVANRRLREGQRLGAVLQKPFAHQSPARGPHETGFHLDRHDTHVFLHAACRRGHADIQQRHHCTPVRDMKGVEMLGFGFIADLRVAAIEHIQVKTQVLNEWNLDGKAHIEKLSPGDDADTTVDRQPLAGDMFACI